MYYYFPMETSRLFEHLPLIDKKSFNWDEILWMFIVIYIMSFFSCKYMYELALAGV